MTGFLILAFLILIAGVLAVPLATRIGLGSVLGYLLAGMAISPLLAALSVDVEALQVFAEFGVVMMLFIIGLEMEPKRLWAMRGKLAGLGGGQVVLTTLVLTGIALLAVGTAHLSFLPLFFLSPFAGIQYWLLVIPVFSVAVVHKHDWRWVVFMTVASLGALGLIEWTAGDVQSPWRAETSDSVDAAVGRSRRS